VKKKAVPEGTAKFREETSKKDSDPATPCRCLHKLGSGSFVCKRFFAPQHARIRMADAQGG
jgi:hypothetical protein